MAKPLQMRLSDLLEQKQEPFLLDAYLQENGCSRRKKAGTFRLIITKLLYPKLIKKALNGERVKLAACFSELRGKHNAAGLRRLSSPSTIDNGEPPNEEDEEIGCKNAEQSPVSVLFELHSDDASSDHNHSMIAKEQEMLPAENKRELELHSKRQVLLDYLKELELKNWESSELARLIFPWEKQRGDVQIFTHLVELDLCETTREWTIFHDEKTEIGREIEGIIFEELMREECVLGPFHCTLLETL